MDPHDYRKRRYAPPYCLCHECYVAAYAVEFPNESLEFVQPEFPPPEWREEYEEYLKENPARNEPSETGASGMDDLVMEEEEEEKRVPRRSTRKTPPPSPPRETVSNTTSSKRGRKRKMDDTGEGGSADEDTTSKIEILEPGKNARLPNSYGPPPCPLNEFRIEVAMIRPKTVCNDPAMESPVFNVRDDFLDLCRGNHYQFDDLRRAKHSTAMILFFLHNPESETFMHHCNNCQQDIQGVRYTCASGCADFDLCPSCNDKISHPHPLTKFQPATSSEAVVSPAATSASPQLSTQEQEKQREIVRMQTQEILDTFPHASTCPGCSLLSCIRAKKLFEHLVRCPTNGVDCMSCKRGWTLVLYHSRRCHVPGGRCPVPQCEEMKRKSRSTTNQSSDRRVMQTMQRQTQHEETTPQPGAAGGLPGNPLEPSSTLTGGAAASPEATTESTPRPMIAAHRNSAQFGGKGKRASVE